MFDIGDQEDSEGKEGELSVCVYMNAVSDYDQYNYLINLQGRRDGKVQQLQELTQSQTINSTHTNMMHDIEYDYYGDKLATCASDGYLHIYDVSKATQQNLIASIKVRDSPLWALAWAHPRFGAVLAVSSFDGDVSIYREQKEWIKVASHSHQSSVNCIDWQPQELVLACSGTDGQVFLLDNESAWNVALQWHAHDSSVHGIKWSPDGKLLATASSDKSIKIWTIRLSNTLKEHHQMMNLLVHNELVRDIDWHPIMESDDEYTLVSGGEDGRTVISKIHEGEHEVVTQFEFHIPIWKVAFNRIGNQIAVSMESNGVAKIQVIQVYNYVNNVVE